MGIVNIFKIVGAFVVKLYRGNNYKRWALWYLNLVITSLGM
jgi:hypothetical protein